MLIDLIPEMAMIFNEFISNYIKKAEECKHDSDKLFRLHNEMINIYAIRAIKLAIISDLFIDDKKSDGEWNEWMRKHGS